MKKVLFLMLFTTIAGIAGMDAQVKIGENTGPRQGAILDLKSHYIGGLLLPNVEITDMGKIPGDFSDQTVAGKGNTTETAKLAGMVVWNTNPCSKGAYVWNGTGWLPLSVAKVPVEGVDIGLEGEALLDVRSNLQLTAAVFPDCANQDVTWSIVSGNAATVHATGVVTGREGLSGVVTVRATSLDDETKFKDIDIYVLTEITGDTEIEGAMVKYKVFCYPDNLGCWMTENSREGNPTQTTYPGHATGERGYYYYPNRKATACPPGWQLPSEDDAKSLIEYTLASVALPSYLLLTRLSLAAGYWSYLGWEGWSEINRFKTDSDRDYYVYRISLTSGSTNTVLAAPVRCRLGN